MPCATLELEFKSKFYHPCQNIVSNYKAAKESRYLQPTRNDYAAKKFSTGIFDAETPTLRSEEFFSVLGVSEGHQGPRLALSSFAVSPVADYLNNSVASCMLWEHTMTMSDLRIRLPGKSLILKRCPVSGIRIWSANNVSAM
jgi:hypothetical protein